MFFQLVHFLHFSTQSPPETNIAVIPAVLPLNKRTNTPQLCHFDVPWNLWAHLSRLPSIVVPLIMQLIDWYNWQNIKSNEHQKTLALRPYLVGSTTPASCKLSTTCCAGCCHSGFLQSLKAKAEWFLLKEWGQCSVTSWVAHVPALEALT